MERSLRLLGQSITVTRVPTTGTSCSTHPHFPKMFGKGLTSEACWYDLEQQIVADLARRSAAGEPLPLVIGAIVPSRRAIARLTADIPCDLAS